MDEELDDLEVEQGVVTLTDDNGNEVEFEFLDLVEVDGVSYVVLLPSDPEEGEEGEVVILRVDEDEQGEVYNAIEEDEAQAVFEIFKDKFKDDFEFENE